MTLSRDTPGERAHRRPPRPRRGSPWGRGCDSGPQTGLRLPALLADVPFLLVRLLGPVPIREGYGRALFPTLVTRTTSDLPH